MKKSELIEHFTKNYVDPLHQEAIISLEDILENQYEELKEGLVAAYNQLFEKIKQVQSHEKKEIKYIYLHLLRTGIETKSCLITAYDKRWYADPNPIEISYNVSWLWQPFIDYVEKLHQEKKRYVMRINHMDVQRAEVKKWDSYLPYITFLLKSAIEDITNLPSYDFEKSNIFALYVGEYRDHSDMVWIEDRTFKDPEAIKELLRQRTQQKLCYIHLSDLDLSSGEYPGNDIMNSRFERINLKKTRLDVSLLMKSIFKDCDLSYVSLIASGIWFSDFSGSNLKKANLQYVNHYICIELPIEKMTKKYFPKTKFIGCNLEEADLSYGDFTAADFTDANMLGCKFEGTILTGAKIDKSQTDHLELTEEQREVITWV